MFTTAQRQTIRRPIEDVFEFLAHFENRPRFESDVVEATVIANGVLGEGTRYREIRTFAGFRTVTVHQITQYQPPSRLRFRSVSGPIPLEGDYRLTEESGTTSVEFELAMAPRGVMGLASGLLRRKKRNDLARFYHTLTQVLESQAAQP